jgi:predicted RNA-binding protein
MCELSVYTIQGTERQKVMDGVVRIAIREGKVLMEGILGESLEVEGKLVDVDIMAQEATIQGA